MRTTIHTFYSSVITALFIGLVIGQLTAAPRIQRVDEIDVHRLNIRDADGTLRLVIANRARLPGVIVKGKEQPAIDRPQAGMLFTTMKVLKAAASFSEDGVIRMGRSRTRVEACRSTSTAAI